MRSTHFPAHLAAPPGTGRAAALCLCLAGLWLLAGLAAGASAPALPPPPGAVPDEAPGPSSAPPSPTLVPTPALEIPGTPALPRRSPGRPVVRVRAAAPPAPPSWVAGGAAGIRVALAAPAEVLLGDRLEYTLVVTNASGQGATVSLFDVLAVPSRDEDVACHPSCLRDRQVISVTIVTPGQYGAPPYTVYMTLTYQVRWAALEMPDGSSATAEFSFPIDGLDDGQQLSNRAYVTYTLESGQGGAVLSEEIESVVRVRVPPGSSTAVSELPVWVSEDRGGTGSLEWGDYDRDGDLDLAVGGSTGTTVYRNSAGRLAPLWTGPFYTHDVRWIDIDGQGPLELVTIGYNWWTEAISNHVYLLAGAGDRFEEVGPTELITRLLSIEPADVDGDGDLDLLAATYSYWSADGCSVRVYTNTYSTNGAWFNTPYRCLLALEGRPDAKKEVENWIALGDYDNDDRPDLLLDVWDEPNPSPPAPCPYRDALWLVPGLTATAPITIDLFTNCNFPVAAAWGDYDRDGDLDLAAAVPALTGPNQHEIRIYENRLGEGGNDAFAPPVIITPPGTEPPFAVAWSDFDADGDLDLAAGAMPCRVYLNHAGGFDSNRFIAPPVDSRRGFALDLAAADYDNDGDVDLATGNPLAPSALYALFVSRLTPSPAAIALPPAQGASSVAWGDANGDGTQDLLFGAGSGKYATRLYRNVDGAFAHYDNFPSSGVGPHSVAFADVDADGDLEVAIGAMAEIQLYQAGEFDDPFWTSQPGLTAVSLAWADADNDGDLDLAAALDNGRIYLFDNVGQTLSTAPAWISPRAAGTRGLAWADADGDRYMDLAVGVQGQASRLYHNNGDGTFTAVWNTGASTGWTTSLAWADYDADGDPDLSLGNDGQPNVIYENDAGALGSEPVWVSDEISHTTALAWGDWDNDGDLDLAVGNRDEPNQVYLNLGSRPGRPRLAYLWRSARVDATTAVAWGDLNGDGDLDLAVAATGGVGYHTNYGILSSHLVQNFVVTTPLPDNQSYVSVRRPGETAAAYFHSDPRVLSGPDQPTVTIEYALFDADGTRGAAGSNEPGDPLAATVYEYSLDGGGTWQPATPAGDPPLQPVTTTRRLGQPAVFEWDAQADAAISDDARFRVSIVALKPAGPVQHALTRAVSPPFRVRGTTCTWPIHPAIQVSDPTPNLGEEVTFVGSVAQGSGILTFTWNFADGATAQGQLVRHRFSGVSTYRVRLTVTSEPCPEAKILRTHRDISVWSGLLYVPVVEKRHRSP